MMTKMMSDTVGALGEFPYSTSFPSHNTVQLRWYSVQTIRTQDHFKPLVSPREGANHTCLDHGKPRQPITIPTQVSPLLVSHTVGWVM